MLWLYIVGGFMHLVATAHRAGGGVVDNHK